MIYQFKFSGHETFHCRHFWLKKGVDHLSAGNSFKNKEAVVELGVGKNMVTSISHWLKAFGLANIDLELTELANLLLKDGGYDEYLESEGSLWLLHYQLQKVGYSSIYNKAFNQFRKSRVSFDFTLPALTDYLIRQCKVNNIQFSANTISSDVKIFSRSYCPPKRGSKNLEDDLSALFIDLRLIYEVDGLKDNGDQVYRFNYGLHQTLPALIFLFAIMDQFDGESSITFEDIQRKVGDVFLCNQEQTHLLIDDLVENEYVVYNEDAGRKEIQMKTDLNKWEILKNFYE